MHNTRLDIYIYFIYSGLHVKEFMAYYSEEFPFASATPKRHMLEDHVVPWMQRWHASPGFHAEQTAESIQAIFSSLGRTYTSVLNPQVQLRLIFQEHQLQVCSKMQK